MEKPIDQSTADRLTQSIAKQKKKPKKQKSKSVSSNDRTTDDSDAPLANRKCDEVLQQLTECLRISDCDVVTNGDCGEHTSKLSLASANMATTITTTTNTTTTKPCTAERNSCFNQSTVHINCDAANLSNETIVATAAATCTATIAGSSTVTPPSTCNKNVEKVCNGLGHSLPDDEPSSSSASSNQICTEIEPKLINEIDQTPSSAAAAATATAAVTSTTISSSSSPSATSTGTANVKHSSLEPEQQDIEYKVYENELQMPDIMRLIQKDLSEPYSIYTYRYFIHNWPKLCFLAMHGTNCVGAIVCKLDFHRQQRKRGYIAMLAVDKDYRKLKIGTNLVAKAIQAMLVHNADEVVLETEITNIPALRLYENLGFVRDKRLFGYYLNGVDALRLKLWFR